MSTRKYDRLRKRFTDLGVPLKWKDFVRFIKYVGAVEEPRSQAGGSQRTFSIGEVTFSVHEPHAREPNLPQWVRKKVISLLMREGLINDEEENKKN